MATPSQGARDAWVDLAKGIGILLVVYGHVARGLFNARIPMDKVTYQVVDAAIYSFHMPLFFFLSGLFFLDSLRKRGPGRLVLNKLDTIVYPYLLWSILQGGVEVVLSRWTNGHVGWWEVLSLWQPRAHFWFLYALFGICLLGTVAYAARSAARALPWLVGGAAVGLYAARPWLPDVPNLGYVTTYFVYFAAGVCLRDVQVLVQRHGGWLLAPLGLGFAVAQHAYASANAAGQPVGPAAHLGLALLGIGLVVVVSQQLAARWRLPLLAALGRASMAIYLVHVLAGSGVRIALTKFLHTQNLTLHLAAGCVAGVGVSMLLLSLAKRWRPLSALFESPWPLERGVRRQGAL